MLHARNFGMPTWLLTELSCWVAGTHAAMEAEASPLVKSLNLKLDDPPVIPPPAPCLSYSGEDYGATIHLVCFGTLAGTAARAAAFLRCVAVQPRERSLQRHHMRGHGGPAVAVARLHQPPQAAGPRYTSHPFQLTRPGKQEAPATVAAPLLLPSLPFHPCSCCLSCRQVQGAWRGQCGHCAGGPHHLPGHPGLPARHCHQHRHCWRVPFQGGADRRCFHQHRHGQPRPPDTAAGGCCEAAGRGGVAQMV